MMGSPIGNEDYCQGKFKQLTRESESTLSLIEKIPDAQIGFHLHRMCGNAPKISHVLRTCPPHATKELASDMDDLSREGFSAINGYCPDDTSWKIATLPIRLGGLGLTLCSDIRLAAACGSTVDSSALVSAISATTTVVPTISAREGAERARPIGEEIVNEYQLEPDTFNIDQLWATGRSQSTLSKAVHASLLSQLMPEHSRVDYTSRSLRALLLGSSSKGGSAWLGALPSPTAGGQANNPTWRTQLMLRTRHAMFTGSETCPSCERSTLDRYGHHALVCASGFGHTRRHTALISVLRQQVFTPAGIKSVAEKHDLLPGTEDRPADIYTETLDEEGLPTSRKAYDITIRSPYTTSHLAASSREAGATARMAEEAKMTRYSEACASLQPPIQFEPLAFDCTGSIGPRTMKTIQRLARTTSCYGGAPDDVALRQIQTTISTTLMKYFALQVNSRMTVPESAANQSHRI